MSPPIFFKAQYDALRCSGLVCTAKSTKGRAFDTLLIIRIIDFPGGIFPSSLASSISLGKLHLGMKEVSFSGREHHPQMEGPYLLCSLSSLKTWRVQRWVEMQGSSLSSVGHWVCLVLHLLQFIPSSSQQCNPLPRCFPKNGSSLDVPETVSVSSSS